MNKTKKELTVLLPIYKESNEFVELSIDSILNQTFEDFDLYVILDDPSNDRLIDLMNKYVKKDGRILFEINDKNLGLPLTLNKMLEKVETKYVARMDADDIADVLRLKKQYDLMENDKNIDLCGTNIIYIDNDGKELHKKQKLPESSEKIKKKLLYIDVLCHPTFFAKSSVLKKMKYRNLKYAQDYDLVCRLAEKNYELANINEYLLHYRTGNVGSKKLLEQRITSGEIQKYYKKSKLNKIDIEKVVLDKIVRMKDSDVKRYKKSNDIYEKGVILVKRHKYFRGGLRIISSLLYSKYQRKNFVNMLKYKLN